MASLCPVCGKYLCDHTAEERGQTEEEFNEDTQRLMTPEEEAAWHLGDKAQKLAAAKMVAIQRKDGTFKPKFPWDK